MRLSGLPLLFLPFLASCADADRLAQENAGGWVNIDFVSVGDPLSEAQSCVRSRPEASAVACFAFPSREDYAAADAAGAGNFKGDLCWAARWQRNQLGTESGGTNQGRPASCPTSLEPRSVAPSAPATAAPDSSPIEVTLDVQYERASDGRLRIVGSTNLPPATHLSFSLTASDRRFMAQDGGEVRDGRFASTWFSDRGRPLAPGRYVIGVTVPIYNTQPYAVKVRLGPGLERMTGPHVELHSVPGLGKTASRERTLEIN